MERSTKGKQKIIKRENLHFAKNINGLLELT